MSEDSLTPQERHILDLENKRCAALGSGDLSTLGQLLSRDLLHVHTRGNSDSYESYLDYMRSFLEVLKVERGELRVRIYGETAVMTGTQVNTARLRIGDPQVMRIESKAMQVWAKEADGQWRLAAFQATPIGVPTPVN
ncbi:ketosteroid isomerase-like enzyme [Pseudomonas sp. GM21]|uniref:nuclear transport factor 2 family protein n=1 Tax=Pseudomonas sp. GM21 TaxID=1144325 RepID=UPI000272590B|nr:nuclear transport factor 2 family protein [Pseudomonas sp. GM21]EJM22915.1 ketosteroid isomerase-like enzyme [Pseudomonas sp. GM21]